MKTEDIKKELHDLGEEPKVKNNEPEKVMVDKVAFENLMSRLEKLEKGVSAPELDTEPEELKHTVKVRYLNDKVVIGYGKTYEKKDVDGRKYLMLQVITEDNKTTEVEYLPFMNQGVFELAEVEEIIKHYTESSTGKVYQTEYDYKNFRSVVTDKLVDLKVVTPDFKYKLKLKNGKTITLPQGAIN